MNKNKKWFRIELQSPCPNLIDYYTIRSISSNEPHKNVGPSVMVGPYRVRQFKNTEVLCPKTTIVKITTVMCHFGHNHILNDDKKIIFM